MFLDYLKLIRPWQWMKNLMIFFPPFLSGAILHPGMLVRGLLPLLVFCCASSSAYIFNDLCDLQRDSQHPFKSRRPLPSGAVSQSAARVLFVVLALLTVLMGWQMSATFLGFVLAYLTVSLSYSLWLKRLPIIDIFSISLGFVLRLYAGGEAFGVYISDWLFLTVFLLAVFLSVGKRYSERRNLGQAAAYHRETLNEYPDGFLESAMYLAGAAVLVTYAIYAISTPLLVYSVPLCMFGLLRYLMRIKSGQSGDPTDALIRDFQLMATGAIWVLIVGWSVYR